jgi:hypothetical protein
MHVVMSAYATDDGSRTTTTTRVGLAAAAGILAGLVFGVLIQFRLERMTAIGAMYTLGEPSLTAGWIAHMFHSALFGAFFGLVADVERTRSLFESALTAAGAGAVYAAGLWAVYIVFVWPLWLNATSFGAQIPFPNLAVMPLVGHLVWGALLGAAFHAVLRAR